MTAYLDDDTKALNRIAAALEGIDFGLRSLNGVQLIANGLQLMTSKPGALSGEAEHFLKHAVRSSIDELAKQIKKIEEQEAAE